MRRRRGARSAAAVAGAVGLVAALGFSLQMVPAGAAPAAGGPQRAGSSAAPAISQDAHHDVSSPLGSLAPKPSASNRPPREVGRPTRPTVRPAQPDAALQTSAATPSAATSATTFEGVDNVNGVVPPDTNGAVGPSNYVQWVNLSFKVFDKSGTTLYGPAAGNTLWTNFGGLCETTNQGDPVVRYDALAHRWVFTQFAFNSSGTTTSGPDYECFAVSTGPDPLGTYYRYSFQLSTTDLGDYPKLGIWPDGYYFSTNQFAFSGGAFDGPATYALDRNAMLSGAPATMVSFTLGTKYFGLLPADVDGTTPPPSGADEYFAAIDGNFTSNNVLYVWRFHVNWGAPSSSTFSSTPTTLTTASYNLALCLVHGKFSTVCVPQPSTSQSIDTLGDRLMYRLAYRNFGGHQSLVAGHTVNVLSSGFQAGVRWYELQTPDGTSTPTLANQGTWAPDADNRFMPSVAMDAAGDIAVGYSVSSASTSPSIRYAVRVPTDPAGTLETETTMTAGGGSQTGYSRWGDYSAMAVDPSNDCSFWYTNEYYSTSSTVSWQTRVGSFHVTTCTAPQMTVSPSGLAFGNQVQNTPSTPRTVTVTNPGTANLVLSNPTVSGANASDFSPSAPSITTVPPGSSATISVTFTPGTTGPRSATLSIPGNATLTPLTVALSGTGTVVPGAIAGTVTDGTTHAGLASICVVTYDSSNVQRGSTTTSSSGTYQLSGLLPDSYKVGFRDCSATPIYGAGWYNGSATYASANAVTVTSGTTATVNMALAAGGSIAGTVTAADTSAGLGGVCVAAFATSDGTYVGSTTTAGNGSYTIPGIGSGTYALRFVDCSTAPRYATQWYNNQLDFPHATGVTVTSPAATTSINSIMQVAGTISGTVRNASTQIPVAGICVAAYTASSTATVGYLIHQGVTAANGTYTLGGMPPGAGTVKVRFTDCSGTNTFATQWYNNQASYAAANAISITSGATTSGIDANLS